MNLQIAFASLEKVGDLCIYRFLLTIYLYHLVDSFDFGLVMFFVTNSCFGEYRFMLAGVIPIHESETTLL